MRLRFSFAFALFVASGISPIGYLFCVHGGSSSCRECHNEAFKLWQKSNHGLAERTVNPFLDQPAFDSAQFFQSGAQTSSISWNREGGKIATVGLSRKSEVHCVNRVIGHDPLRQFLVPARGGRWQTLEASYDPHRKEWFNVYGNEDRQPGEWGHWTGRGMNWNSMCAACHNTSLRKNYDAVTDTYNTTMAEMSVGCEACHGPLKKHNEWQQQFGKSGKNDPTVPKMSRDQRVDYCGSCHARRSDLTGDFQPGNRFDDHFDLRHVDRTATFYPDGQVREEDYEFAPFLGSKMHQSGVICTDCHNPHSGKTILPGNWLCLRCHDGSDKNAPVINPVAHSFHRVFGFDTNGVATNLDLATYRPKEIKETGGECVNCHMPQTVYMQRHWRHDHGFTIPDPLLTQQHGIPNACNRCHQDKNVEWAIAWTDKWYGKKMDRPTRQRAQFIAAAIKNDISAREPLLKMLASEPIPYWRASIVSILEPWTTHPTVSAALVKAADDTNSMVRAAAVSVLESALDGQVPGIENALQRALSDTSRNVRVSAAWASRSTLDTNTPAAKELKQFLDYDADQPSGQYQTAVFHFYRGDFTNALQHARKAVEWDPYSPPYRWELAAVLNRLDRTPEAIEHLKELCRFTPKDAEAHNELGNSYYQLKDWPHAIEAFAAAVKADQHMARAWLSLGLAQAQAGQPVIALESLLRAESENADDASIPYTRATILAKLGKTADARKAVSRALEINPTHSEAKAFLEKLR